MTAAGHDGTAASDPPGRAVRTRAEVLARLAEHLWRRSVPHTLRVAVDGPDTAGKTRLADDLARVLDGRRDVVRVSVDGFHRPAEIRRRGGALSPEGYYRDSFDHDAIVREVLRPLGPGGDGHYRPAMYHFRTECPVSAASRAAPVGAVLLFDEVFLSADVVRQRYRERYLPGQELYRAEARPAQRADVVLDMADPHHPAVVRWTDPAP